MIWKTIINYPFLEISDTGLVRSKDREVLRRDGKKYPVKGKILSPFITKCGYLELSVSFNGNHYHLSIHREVANAFLSKESNGTDVNHKDGNKLNNNVDNLEWVTKSENMQHAMLNGLWCPSDRKGEKHPLSKLTYQQVEEIRTLLEEGTLTQHEIALRYNVCDERISRIKHNKTWT